MRTSKEGQTVPSAELAELRDGKVKVVTTEELFKGRRVVLFALPGAFTPTCSTAHVPGYVARLADFRAAGVADIVCVSVNDPFVMQAWQQSEKAQGIHFMADAFGRFTEAMGMSIDHRDALLGVRSWRYSMLVEDGVIRKMFIEPEEGDDPFKVSDAETMLKYIQPDREASDPVLMLARHGCQYCERAQSLLQERGIAFDVVYLGDGLTMRGVLAASGESTVPQVFIAGKRIGGSDQLAQYLASPAA